MRKVIFEPDAFEHIRYWAGENTKLLKRIFDLIEDARRNPFKSLGKPKPLKYSNGYWSRRINDEHRLVYKVTSETVIIATCRFHYDD
jgi:toxin YoeB